MPAIDTLEFYNHKQAALPASLFRAHKIKLGIPIFRSILPFRNGSFYKWHLHKRGRKSLPIVGPRRPPSVSTAHLNSRLNFSQRQTLRCRWVCAGPACKEDNEVIPKERFLLFHCHCLAPSFRIIYFPAHKDPGN